MLALTSVRARPSSAAVALSVRASATGKPRAGFALERVNLDASGQIASLRITPADEQLAHAQLANEVPVDAFGVEEEKLRITPHPAAMHIEVLAAFQLSGVELSASFSAAALVLNARDPRMRITLRAGVAHPGATFRPAKISLDPCGRIAEILLEAVV
jgi:hypothetical protein